MASDGSDRPVRVAVVGAGGRMGTLSCRTIAAEQGMELVGAVGRSHAGLEISAVTGAKVLGEIAGSLETLRGAQPDVVVDFTPAEVVRRNADWCAANVIHMVIGSSGLGVEDYGSLKRQFVSCNCIVAPNLAIGAILMMRFAELASPYFESGEIIEIHHDQKVDAPSGTAMLTAQRMASSSSRWSRDRTTRAVLDGARGGEAAPGIRVHSIRLRGAVAHQEILFGTTGHSLRIRHDSYDRSSFMPGLVL
ncbi:MAG: 4-hydroxy-tetrahydrodipicolinate reductase, partial [Gammaproteobacteria bacterium]